LIAYADEQNGGIGQRFADILRQNGDSVDYFRCGRCPVSRRTTRRVP